MPKMKIGVGIMCVMTLILSVQGRILHLEESIKVARLVQFKLGQILEDLFRLGIAMADRLIRISRSHDVKTPV